MDIRHLRLLKKICLWTVQSIYVCTPVQTACGIPQKKKKVLNPYLISLYELQTMHRGKIIVDIFCVVEIKICLPLDRGVRALMEICIS